LEAAAESVARVQAKARIGFILGKLTYVAEFVNVRLSAP
jgi:hypothetical protein